MKMFIIYLYRHSRDSHESMGDTGKVQRLWERPMAAGKTASGADGSAVRKHVSERRHPNIATTRVKEKHPQGAPRGGAEDVPNQIDNTATTGPNRTTSLNTDSNNTVNQMDNTVTTGPPRITSLNTDSNKTCVCGKTLKNEHGLRIHQGRMKCLKNVGRQRLGATTSSETGEESGQDLHQSTRNLPVEQQTDAERSELAFAEPSQEQHEVFDEPSSDQLHVAAQQEEKRKDRIEWPPSSKKKAWSDLDQDLDNILTVTLRGPVENKLKTMTELVYRVCADRFGIKTRKEKVERNSGPNRRQREIAVLRKELRNLRRLWRNASAYDKEGLAQLREDARKRLLSLRKAENSAKKKRQRVRERETFVKNPYQYASKLLGKSKSGDLECTREELENHLSRVHNDIEKDTPLGDFNMLVREEEPLVPFDMSDIKKCEVDDVVKKARAASAPGPSGTSYRLYKNCPLLRCRLWKLYKVLWKKEGMPSHWGKAEGVYVPKEENSTGIGQFRPISLLSTEVKIFLSIISIRTTRFMICNKYIDTSVQKGGIPGFSGCLEHNSVITELIQRAKKERKSLSVVWLDMANAYGSIPHAVIYHAMDTYHIPDKVKSLVKNYFDSCRMRFTVGGFTTSWQNLEKGIMTGCTVSIILFVMAMNIILKQAQRECRGPLLDNVRQPSCRAFVDDITVMTESPVGARWILSSLEKITRWARMSFKGEKSRSLIILKGVVRGTQTFTINNTRVPTISEKPIKCLGKYYDDSLKDVSQVKEVKNQFKRWMEKINTCGLPGRFRLWCYQFILLPKLMWPLLVYDVPISTVEEMERTASRHMRHWLGLPSSFSNIGLYCRTSKLVLPVTSVTEEFKVTKVRSCVTLRDTDDPVVRSCKIKTRSGRKWSASGAVEEAESRLRHQLLVGTVCHGRQGLGFNTQASTAKSDESQRDRIVREVRASEDDRRVARAVQMGQQGAWTKWSSVMRRELKWSDMWRMSPLRTKFLLNSVHDVLPTPSNLFIWGKDVDPKCVACGRWCNLEHILSSCNVSLTSGRYTWRHNEALKIVVRVLNEETKIKHAVKSNRPQFINFKKSGETTGRTCSQPRTGILQTARDWKVVADLCQQSTFPPHIVQTAQRPDIILYSDSTHQIILVELTIPWESRVEEAHERKSLKYAELKSDCISKGWKCWCFPIEVTCRGFPAKSVLFLSRSLGMSTTGQKKLLREVSETTENASCWIWNKHRQDQQTTPPGRI